MRLWHQLMTLLLCTLVSLVNPTLAAPLCLPNLEALYPFSTPAGQARVNSDVPIIPGDVFEHLQRLKASVASLGITLDDSIPTTLELHDVLPRHNYVLAFDLLVLLQLWHQQEQQVAHITPAFNYPSTINPVHVYGWIDASLALTRCFQKQSRNSSLNGSSLDITASVQITPRDVYFQLDRLVNAIAQQISPDIRQTKQTMRLNQIYYYLQDILMSRGHSRLVVWQDRHGPDKAGFQELEDVNVIASRVLSRLDKLNGRNSLAMGTDKLGYSGESHSHLFSFQLSLIFGELQTWSLAQGFAESPPPLVPVVHAQKSFDLMSSRLSQVLAWLDQVDSSSVATSKREGNKDD